MSGLLCWAGLCVVCEGEGGKGGDCAVYGCDVTLVEGREERGWKEGLDTHEIIEIQIHWPSSGIFTAG